MDGRTILFVVVTIFSIVSTPFIVDAIRKKDFNDQVSGKKKMHKVPESYKINNDHHSSNSAAEQVAQKGIEQAKIDTKSIHL